MTTGDRVRGQRGLRFQTGSTPERMTIPIMKTTRIALTALALLALLGRPAACEQIWLEQKVTGDGAGPSAPVMWGNTIWWVDSRSYPNGYYELRKWDSVGGEQVVRQVPKWTTPEAVYDQSLVYFRYAADYTTDLYLWDSVNGERTISTAPGYQMEADIYGETVVYEDHSSGSSRVWIWDPVNGERRITSAESHQVNPQVWGDTVVWEDRRGGQPGIYTWNPTDGERFIGCGVSPAIHDGKVVAWELAQETQWEVIPGHLWEWTSEGGYRELWETSYSTTANVVGTQLCGDLVAWGIGFGPGGVMSWHPRYGLTQVSLGGLSSVSSPSLYGDSVAWVGNYNVYVSTLVPEPSSLMALAGCMGALLTYASRRRKRI